MPFRLANDQGAFQQLMSVVPSEIQGFVIAYFDGILVFSKTLEEQVKHLQKVPPNGTWFKAEIAKMPIPGVINKILKLYNL